MKNNRKVLYGLVALALLLSVVGISIGFAAMSQELKIEGTAEVVPASWSILFKDLSQKTVAGDGQELDDPTLTATIIKDFDVRLTKPGDSVSYTFKVANDGTIDAKLSDIQFGTPTYTGTATGEAKTSDESIVASNLVFTLKYLDGTTESDLSVGDTLAHDTYRTLKLTVAYDESADELPTAAVEIEGLSVTLTYVQD